MDGQAPGAAQQLNGVPGDLSGVPYRHQVVTKRLATEIQNRMQIGGIADLAR